MHESDHFVQFYETDEFLIDSVNGFVAAALDAGNSSLVIATLEHRVAIERKLTASGISVAAAIESGQYVALDAADTLSKLMADGLPSPLLFQQYLGGIVSRLAQDGRRVHAFGEMVALLWANGNRHAAIRLEELWNELGKALRFTLFCAYPMSAFGDESCAVPFNGICACHSRVIPAESYADIDSADERLRAVSLLQQKAQSLEAEIRHRAEVEKSACKRERELAEYVENAPAALNKINSDGKIAWANRADYESLGYARNEYVGHPVGEFHADANTCDEILERMRQGESLNEFPASLRAKDGSVRQVLFTSNACFESGKFAYARFTRRDTT
jgi:PAS domain S-box-containing protein